MTNFEDNHPDFPGVHNVQPDLGDRVKEQMEQSELDQLRAKLKRAGFTEDDLESYYEPETTDPFDEKLDDPNYRETVAKPLLKDYEVIRQNESEKRDYQIH